MGEEKKEGNGIYKMEENIMEKWKEIRKKMGETGSKNGKKMGKREERKAGREK